MSIILRRTTSMASKQTLASLASMDHRLYHLSSIGAIAAPTNDVFSAQMQPFPGFLAPKGIIGPGILRARSFHSGSGPMNFRASLPVSQLTHAVAYDDAKSSKAATDEGLEISSLGISQDIVSALAKKGITKLFPIQSAVLEPAMQGRDMIGRARTGTGKTLAFGIPILDKIIRHISMNGRGRSPMAIVLAPTRELARQVDKEFSETAPTLQTICVYGGTPISRQMSDLRYGVDVVVGTPGRVIDLLKRGALNLSAVQFVVLDEADQMLNVGFQEDVEVIMENLPPKRQSLMFSATMPGWIRQLTARYLKDPVIIDLVGDSDQKLADGITIYSIASSMYGKPSIIGPLITEHAKGGKCIVFTQTKRDADRLAHHMARDIKCEALHGDIAQNQRERTLFGFREGHFSTLVATDVASRGLDIPNVDLVVHYELPTNSEIFVHRTGRTGRAGKKGNAILIHTDDELRTVRTIERDIGSKFIPLPRIAVEGGGRDTFGDFGGSRQMGGSGGFDRYGSNSGGFGRPAGRYGGSGLTGSGSRGGFGGSGGGYGGSGGGYGGSGGFGGGSGGGYGGGSRGSGGFGGYGGYGGSSSRQSGGFGDRGSNRSGSFGRKRPSTFGSFGDGKSDDEQDSWKF